MLGLRKPTKLKALGDLADIRTGFTFREKVEELSSGGNAHVAQIKDVRSVWEHTNTATLQAFEEANGTKPKDAGKSALQDIFSVSPLSLTRFDAPKLSSPT